MDLSSLHRFHIAPGFDPAAPDTWVWENRSADVNHKSVGVQIRGGRPDEVGQVEAGSADLEVDNAGGHYCTRNPLGRWYGRLARNCPARWGTISGAAAFGTNATNGWGSPDVGASWTLDGSASNWSVSTGMGRLAIAAANQANSALLNGADARDGDATWVSSCPVVTTGAAVASSLLARNVDGSNRLYFFVEFNLSGVISARISRTADGAFGSLASTAATGVTYTANMRIKSRAQWIGPNLRLKVWREADPEPDAWTLTATDSLVAGTRVGLYLWRLSGNTNAGSLTVSVDDLQVEAVEIVGTIPAFPVRWDPTATQSWAPIQIAGITRRLSQGQQAVRSPLYRQLLGQGPHGYWPMEDGAGAAVAASALPGGRAATVTACTFGSTDAPPGSAAALSMDTIASSSRVSGNTVSPPLTPNGYAGMAFFRCPSVPAGNTNLFRFFGTGRIYKWQIALGTNNFTLTGVDADGATVVGTSSFLHGLDVTKWFAIQLETEESGGNTNWSFIWNQVGTSTFLAVTGSYTGTADRVTGFTATPPVDGTLVCHVWLGPNTLPFVDAAFLAVSSGYAGELAADRVKRLCTEAGVPVAVEAGTSEPMGAQPRLGLLDLLRATEAADMGLLYESGAVLGYRPRGARLNRPVSKTLTIAPDGDIADPPPEPTDDDLRIRNEWTVSRDGISEATQQDAAHIAANGRYPDTAQINIQLDSRLDDHAWWRVHLGTWDEMRWPQVTIDLTDRDDLLTWWRGRPHAPRITISGVPGQGPVGDTVDLIVEGWQQEITTTSWRLTLNCSPARPWDVGAYDATTARYDSATTTLAGSLTTSATSVAITTTDSRDVWSTTAVPYVWKITGERMTVTAVTAAAGSGPYTQTATVTRAVNGVSKTHAAGERVGLADPARYAL